MNQAIKLSRFSSQSSSIFSSSPLTAVTSRSKGAGSVRFVQVASNKDPKEPKFDNMDIKNSSHKDKDKILNVMEESFGEGYSTRSDEEGFGGVYGGNDECDTEMKIIQDPAHHDSSQGSEVKEKEKARNQTKAHDG